MRPEGRFQEETMKLLLQYINESLEELHHVRWPTRQQAVRLSLVVLAFTAVSAAAFGFLDFFLSLALKFLLSFTS
jgi:preprotein translocase SecE subunit